MVGDTCEGGGGGGGGGGVEGGNGVTIGKVFRKGK